MIAGGEEVERYDLVVVGGGVAGWTAARRAQQLGGRVVVLERHDAGPGFGNGRLSGGQFHAAVMDPEQRTPDELYEVIVERTDGHARPDVARAWADNVARALDFLRAEGGAFAVLDPAQEGQQHVLMPPRAASLGRVWQGKGPDNLLTTMWRNYTHAEGAFRPGHRAVGLEVEGGVVVGVRAETAAGTSVVRGANVLLADGGFQGSPELVARYITPVYKLRGSPMDAGDALRMGLDVGAAVVNMEWFYGYPLFRDALTDDRLWPLPAPAWIINDGLVVDGHGRRIADEGLGGEPLANAIAHCDTPGDCWVVFDERIWTTSGRASEVPANPTYERVGGTIVRADTVAELARAAGLPEPALVAAVDGLNAHWRDGTPVDPPRTGATAKVDDGTEAHAARGTALIDQPPFHAIPIVAGITFAMGGLLVNGRAQVLSAAEEAPIPGLYAAGGAMGGLHGGPRVGVAGGWSEASTFGLLAAEHALGAG